MSKIDFFSRLSRFAKRTYHLFQKKLSKNENIFWYSEKQYLLLRFNSWATFWEVCELKKHIEVASFAMFLLMKCWKFQSTIRISKNAAVCGFYLLVVRVIQQPHQRIMFNPLF